MLITLEGLDGSGKTTVWEALRDRYGGEGTTFTREPTDTWYGEAVDRSIADDDADPVAEFFLYTADHAAHLSNVVRPALERGDVVVSDRYSDSRYAYQSVALDGVVPRPMEYIRGVHQPWTRPPDYTIYLDVPPSVGAARSGRTNKFEQGGFLSRVAENYERLVDLEPGRFRRVDATRSPEDVLDEVETIFEDLTAAD
ncbi:dTMP kinase [Halobacteriaceae archaeon GCM10025711]